MNLPPFPRFLTALLTLALPAVLTLGSGCRSLEGSALADPDARAPITLGSLIAEMSDPDAVARFPEPLYRSLQASSYNRESVHRDQPGWYADSDGLGFLRKESRGGRDEWVILEHEGPGCLTKIWTPFFYFDFNDRTGPNIRVYLDGATDPVLDEGLIALVSGHGSVAAPFAAFTARAGNLYLPIPFARSCRVTLSGKPFYHLVNYRAYPAGTAVETLTRERLAAAKDTLAAAADRLYAEPAEETGARFARKELLAPGGELRMRLPAGANALRQFRLSLPTAVNRPAALRSTVLALTFDGEETVWCPVGDFFSCPDALHPFHTWQRTVTSNGLLTCRWVMPYARSAMLRILNLGSEPVKAQAHVTVQPWTWDARSLHFQAGWRPDDVVPGTPFQDWNYVNIRGRGVYVGDSWTVLNPQRNTWWGEGDEKIYVDDAWTQGFPTHFGTGTEDYYGWAGGVVPDRRDEFDEPFLANVRVGGLDGHTEGFNICTRTRALDAIPFERRLRFDMESSFGTDIRNPWNLLGYSAVTFWYARPGAWDNRPPQPRAARAPILSLEDLYRRAEAIRVAQPNRTPARP